MTVDNYEPLGYGGLSRSGWTCRRPGRRPARRCTASRYGNVGVISLDANELSWEIQGLLGYSQRRAGPLAGGHAARPGARDPRIDFIVAFFHECAFSTCNGHSSDGGVRSTLAPLFSRYQVDLAVQGHNHVYERTNPLIYDADDQQRPVEQAGGRRLPQRARRGRARPGTAPPTWSSAPRARPATAGPARTRPTATSRPGKGSGTTVVGDAKTQIGPYVSERDFSTTLRDRRLVAGPVRRLRLHRPRRHPGGRAGSRTTMTLRFINEQGRELDRVVFNRVSRRRACRA